MLGRHSFSMYFSSKVIFTIKSLIQYISHKTTTIHTNFFIIFTFFESFINQSFAINEQNGFLLVLYVGIGPALISYLLWIKAIKIIGANNSGLFLNLIPIFSSLISIFFLKEKLELFHIVGALLIFTGIYLVIRKNSNEKN